MTELSCYYGQDVSLVWERLAYGMNLEEALFSPIRRRNKPQCKIEYHGITYESKRDFSRKKKISVGCIHEMMVNNNVDFETAADILLEVTLGYPIGIGTMHRRSMFMSVIVYFDCC